MKNSLLYTLGTKDKIISTICIWGGLFEFGFANASYPPCTFLCFWYRAFCLARMASRFLR